MNGNRLDLPSDTAGISDLEHFLESRKEAFDLGEEVYGNILVALTEAVINGMVHGNKQDKAKQVQIAVDKNESQIEFTVSDEGVGFDYENLPDPTAPENIMNAGGRGVFLMRRLADEVEFEAEGSEVRLIFYLD